MSKRKSLNIGEIAGICNDYVFFRDTKKEIAENYNISPGVISRFVKRGIDKKIITLEQRNLAYKRRIS